MFSKGTFSPFLFLAGLITLPVHFICSWTLKTVDTETSVNTSISFVVTFTGINGYFTENVLKTFKMMCLLPLFKGFPYLCLPPQRLATASSMMNLTAKCSLLTDNKSNVSKIF
jgi:hypothetical protein